MFGINTKYEPSFFSDNNISIDELCVVDIDKGNFVFINPKRGQKEKDFPDVPKRFKSVLDENLKRIRKKNDYTSYDIQECFFNFLLNVLEPYPKYLKNDYLAVHETNEIASLLNTDSFYNYVGSSDKYFYQKILETQMFIEMMFQRMLPKDSENKLDIIFFEQKISENVDKKKLFKKGKESTPLLNTDEYNFILYHIIQLNNGPNLSEFDKTHINRDSTLKELILKGIKCTISEQTRRVFFTYVLFPSLSTEMFFPHNFNEYVLPPELKLSVDNVNSRMVALSGFQTQNNTMEDYIHLSWMLIWALSFSYIKDQREKEFRFEQLLNVVDKVQSHQMEVYEIIFKVFLKNNQENFLLILYKKILKRLNVSWEMFHTVSAETGAVVVISGETDYITNGTDVYTVEGGHPIMTAVTGMGCTSTAIVGAFVAAVNDPMVAATAAMAVMSLAGERAAEYSKGNGSMQMNFLDDLYNLTPEKL